MTYKFEFVKYRKVYFAIAVLIMLLAIGSLFYQGLNVGIDFKSGTRLDIQLGPGKINVKKEEKVLKDLGYEKPNTRVGGAKQNLLIFRTDQVLNQKKVQEIRAKFSEVHNKKINIKEQVVDPIIGRELAKNAMYSVLFASIAIIVYVTVRFEYRFAISAIMALVYDVMFTIGFFSLFQIEVDVVFIAAILTIVGYSVNDTIVIFDRIRENLENTKPKKWEELSQVVNQGIHQTLVRSMNTVLTVVFAAATLYWFGGESIANFSLALFLGLASGAFSSIFIASQVWIDWKWRSLRNDSSVRNEV